MKAQLTNLLVFLSIITLSSCQKGEPESQKYLADQAQEVCVSEAENGDKYKDYFLQLLEMDLEDDEEKRARSILQTMEELDKITTTYMQQLDEIRYSIFRSVGEKSFTSGTNTSIVQRKEFPSKTERPVKFDMYKVQNMGSTAVLKNGNEEANQLKNCLNSFRNELVELIARSYESESAKDYSFKAPQVTDFESFDQIRYEVDKSFDRGKVAADDRKIILDLFVKLSKHPTQWDALLAGDIPVLNAIETVSFIQFELLHARSLAFSHLTNRF